MKEGFRVYDTDTHIDPGADVLEKYVDPGFRPPRRPGTLSPRDQIAQRRWGRPVHLQLCPQGLRAHLGRGRVTSRIGRRPRVARRKAAEPRGGRRPVRSDVHFLVPSVWTSVVGLPDVSLEIGLIRAYHRYMHEFCGPYSDRLKGPIVASSRDVREAVHEIREWGNSKWAVAVQPLLDNDRPVDHPDLEPIWHAAEEHDLAIVHHSFTWSPPYFPGYEDMWDNVYLARLCFASLGSDAVHGRVSRRRHIGPLSRPAALRARMRLRLAAVLGPRMDEQVSYVGRTAKLKHLPSEHFAAGRVFCNIEAHEHERCSTWSPVRSAAGC